MKTIKILCVSDLHGNLPTDLPPCDLMLIAGDICPTRDHSSLRQAVWLHKEFKPWLESIKTEKIIGVAGNHDWVWERDPHLGPALPWTYLQDSGTEFQGWKIYGTPWQPRFFDWAFNMDETDRKNRWELIPQDTDILLLHGPPHGFGDWVPYDRVNVGCKHLTNKVREIKPKLVVYGHIHAGYGVYELPGVTMANVSIVDENYQFVNDPTEVTLDVENRRTVTASAGEVRIVSWDDRISS